MIALTVGTALALAALAFVLAPLFKESDYADRLPAPGMIVDASNAEIEALREIEFDHETGKLSDTDYAELQVEYTGRAVQAMRAEAGSRVACPSCGPRPEVDAAYCSQCGRALAL